MGVDADFMKKYRAVSLEEIGELSKEAESVQRKRKNLNLHQLEDNVQRFFNAIEPGTYVRPHRHLDPPKIETFLLVCGSFFVTFFDNDGGIIEKFKVSRESGIIAIDIQPGV